mmetsp:Transcript_10555/g.23381  ORF Transcript_10555/g.23381 Transcript_10555/m.23381 type:complete len:170 (+) Transcript_10555:137-646(+)|eukprot:CAMPEP_0168811872 /NCGR_PEP_ID=MMETSP0726-20121227/4349_1 /TAXON_ID=265536 /ORGANISM="Amphiprora sp., Strain CCMP467" /LENGTH=169 /DNA_ID=CAMNT_0008863949 /DNA_START=117 /DNA_END=629 /DNA_ORIENTATION=+
MSDDHDILQQIQSNTIETLHLSESYDRYVKTPQEFADAMNANTSIRSVIFDGDFLGATVAKERAVIVSCLGNLPHLETVTLADSLVMMGVCMTNLVKNSPSVTTLTLKQCVLQGIPSDFDLFTAALETNTTLKEIRLIQCTVPNDEVQFDTVVDGIQSGGNIAIDVSSS